jgi:hypothetical protein
MAQSQNSKSKAPAKDTQAEVIPKPTGTENVTHDAFNVGGQTSSHVNSGGRSAHGRTSDTDRNVQAETVPQSIGPTGKPQSPR